MLKYSLSVKSYRAWKETPAVSRGRGEGYVRMECEYYVFVCSFVRSFFRLFACGRWVVGFVEAGNR